MNVEENPRQSNQVAQWDLNPDRRVRMGIEDAYRFIVSKLPECRRVTSHCIEALERSLGFVTFSQFFDLAQPANVAADARYVHGMRIVFNNLVFYAPSDESEPYPRFNEANAPFSGEFDLVDLYRHAGYLSDETRLLLRTQEALQSRESALSLENVRLTTEIDDLSTRAKGLKRDLDAQIDATRAHVEMIASLQSDKAALEASNASRESDIHALRGQIEELINQARLDHTKLQDATLENEDLRARYAKVTQDDALDKNAIESLNEILNERNATIRGLTDAVTSKTSELDSTSAALEGARGQLECASRVNIELTGENSSLRGVVGSLEQAIQHGNSSIGALVEQMASIPDRMRVISQGLVEKSPNE